MDIITEHGESSGVSCTCRLALAVSFARVPKRLTISPRYVGTHGMAAVAEP